MPNDPDSRGDANSFLAKLEATVAHKSVQSDASSWNGLTGPDLQKPYGVLRELQSTFTKLPTLRQKIALPQTVEDQRISDQFRTTVSGLVGRYMFDRHIRELLDQGYISISSLMKMHEIDRYCDPSGDYSEFYKDLRFISPGEKALLQKDSEFFDLILGFLDERNQLLARNAIAAATQNMDMSQIVKVNDSGARTASH